MTLFIYTLGLFILVVKKQFGAHSKKRRA